MEGTTTKSKRRHLSADEWRGVLQRFAEGGEALSAFCRREGLDGRVSDGVRVEFALDDESEPTFVRAHVDALVAGERSGVGAPAMGAQRARHQVLSSVNLAIRVHELC